MGLLEWRLIEIKTLTGRPPTRLENADDIGEDRYDYKIE